MWDSYVRRKQAENPRPQSARVFQIEGQKAEYRQLEDADRIADQVPQLPPDVESLAEAADRLDVSPRRLQRLAEMGRIRGAYRLMYRAGEPPAWVFPRDARLPSEDEERPAPRKKPEPAPEAAAAQPAAAEQPAAAPPRAERQLDDRDVRIASLEAENTGLRNLLEEKDRRIADLKQLLDFATRPVIEARTVPFIEEAPDEPRPPADPGAMGQDLSEQISHLARMAEALTRPLDPDAANSPFTEIALDRLEEEPPPDPFVHAGANERQTSPGNESSASATADASPIAPPPPPVAVPSATAGPGLAGRIFQPIAMRGVVSRLARSAPPGGSTLPVVASDLPAPVPAAAGTGIRQDAMDGVAEPPETLAEVPSGVTSPFPEDFEPGEATSPFPEDFEPEDAVESGGTADATAQEPESSQTPERRQSTGDDALDDFVAAAQSAAVPEPAVVVTPRATELAIAVELRAIEAFMASAYSLVESGEHDLRLGNSESSFRFTPRFKRPTASAQDAGEPEDGGEEVEGEELPIGREDDGEPNASFDRTEPAAEPEAPRTAIDAGPAEIDESNTGQGMPQARADYQALAATPPAPPEAPVADPRAPAAPASPADPPAIMPGYPAQPSAPEPVDGRRRFSSWLQSLRRRA